MQRNNPYFHVAIAIALNMSGAFVQSDIQKAFDEAKTNPGKEDPVT